MCLVVSNSARLWRLQMLSWSERLIKETGKQLSLPHDYVDELLHVLDGCSTRNKVVGLEFALMVKYAFPTSHFRFKLFLLTMSAKVHPGYRFLAIINRKTGLENHVLEC
ncbi:hypothetical protein Hdeb2414_s0021g00578911 [Helianthus debilis subsp. tardiflorus]